MSMKEKISRIPWKEYLSRQFVKLFGLIVVTILLIAIMVISDGIGELTDVTYENTDYTLIIILSSLCFFLVLLGFSKIVLFDMAEEFGLRDEDGKMVYNLRFYLFTLLAISFCSSIYLLLDVFLQDTYLEIFPVVLMRFIIDSFELDIPGLSDIEGREFYQTARNLYFGFFFVVIILFSILVFLIILTTFARRRVVGKFKKEEELEEEKEGVRTIYKLFVWILIPFLSYFVIALQETSLGSIASILYLLAAIWWIYQVLKVIFLIVWRGMKITAFITSVNLLVVVPLVVVLWILPAFMWGIWDTIELMSDTTLAISEAITSFIEFLVVRLTDFENIVKLDFIIITIIATLVVGFAEGFAFIAIFSALSRGIEVARTGRVLARSPPRVMVFSKYLLMFGVWFSLLWDSFAGIIEMLKEQLQIDLGIEVPKFFFSFYHEVIIPISEWLATIWPTLEALPYLILPIIFIFSGAFKFLSVTLVTPRVKDRAEVFFLLISTAFVLIITNILGDIYELGIPDAPLLSISGLTTILSSAVGIFENVEAVAFYAGFFFGVFYVIWKNLKKQPVSATFTPSSTPSKPTDLTLETDDTAEISEELDQDSEETGTQEEDEELDQDSEETVTQEEDEEINLEIE
ncbi:MAG: hypothetical protein ACW97P_03115 [Candidatus Hodarchaeales archaeon]